MLPCRSRTQSLMLRKTEQSYRKPFLSRGHCSCQARLEPRRRGTAPTDACSSPDTGAHPRGRVPQRDHNHPINAGRAHAHGRFATYCSRAYRIDNGTLRTLETRAVSGPGIVGWPRKLKYVVQSGGRIRYSSHSVSGIHVGGRSYAWWEAATAVRSSGGRLPEALEEHGHRIHELAARGGASACATLAATLTLEVCMHRREKCIRLQMGLCRALSAS